MAERELVGHTLVLLRRPPDAPDLPEDQLDAIQTAHLAHLDALRAAGSLLVSGPVTDQPDESLRGLAILTLGLEEARAATSQDPAVKARRLVADVMTWRTPLGDLP
ncbi:MAG: YciI family protein [Actinomycetota bacterium]|nr:YciI family protein [Actinomycetota bacterium]